MNQPQSIPYGLWPSPLTPLSMARGLTLAEAQQDDDGSLVWLENRSDRGVLVVQPADGQARRDLNSEISVRAKVGYGGGDFRVSRGQVFFISADNGHIYRQSLSGGTPQVVTPAFGQAASPELSPDARWLVYMHTYEDRDVLAVTAADGSTWPQVLASGNDFYMQPCWHPSGNYLAWIAWDHPNMPWDGTRLYLARVQFGPSLPFLENIQIVAGDDRTSIFQPTFSPDGQALSYVSDAQGWWQLYLYHLAEKKHRLLTHAEAEYAHPAWQQGYRSYAFSSDSKSIWIIQNQSAAHHLQQVDLSRGEVKTIPLDSGYTSLGQISVIEKGKLPRIALLASAAGLPPRLITVTPAGKCRVWARAFPEDLRESTYSRPEDLTWKGLDDGTVHGLYYPPANPAFHSEGKPPLIVHIHGGPTSQAINGFNPRAQFFATRGFAFLEVNYRGSSGYGRDYRNKLVHSWGIYDVQDAVSGARSLAGRGLADEGKLVIMGSSAGGYTVLQALEDYPGFFKAGICLYGVSNQFTLAADTHKFEAHYSESLLGVLPEAAEVYRQRSPIYFVDKIQDALAVYQGEEDKVVPRQQSDQLVASLQRRGIPHIYHLYPGEGHGFRKSETIEHFYQAAINFLKEYVVFG